MRYIFISLFLYSFNVGFSAEAPKSKEKLTKHSNVIIECKVSDIFSEDVTVKDDSRNGKGSIDTYFTIKVTVTKVISGNVKKGSSLTINTLKAKKHGLQGVIWNSGINRVPQKGKSYKLFLKKRDKTYWIVTPNGCKVLPEA
jgi:hypothetical protein